MPHKLPSPAFQQTTEAASVAKAIQRQVVNGVRDQGSLLAPMDGPASIILPWPDRRLSPNARTHWAAKAKAAKIARETAYALTKQQRIRLSPGLVPISITFEAPDRRRRDDDNAIGAFKSYRDGIAQALGVDDSIFRPVYRFGEPVKGGRVVVEIAA